VSQWSLHVQPDRLYHVTTVTIISFCFLRKYHLSQVTTVTTENYHSLYYSLLSVTMVIKAFKHSQLSTSHNCHNAIFPSSISIISLLSTANSRTNQHINPYTNNTCPVINCHIRSHPCFPIPYSAVTCHKLLSIASYILS
jgi:hypothetical protein